MKISDAKLKHVSCVYCLTMPNGKSYIGKTRNLSDRLKLYERIYNGDISKENSRVNDAIKEYGLESVDVSILGEVKCSDMVDLELCLSIMEIRYIRELDTIFPKGYNVSLGGEVLDIPIEHLTTDKDIIESYYSNNRIILEYDLRGEFLKEYNSIARYCYERGYDDNLVRKYIGKHKPIDGKYYLREKRYGYIPERIEVDYVEVKERVKYKDVIETRLIVKDKDFTMTSKPVIVYDEEGEFVGEYSSIAEARRKVFSSNSSSIAIGQYYKGFIMFLKQGDDYPKKIEAKGYLETKQLEEYYKPITELEDKPKPKKNYSDIARKHNRHEKLNLTFPINQFKLNGEFVAQYKSIRDASVYTGIAYSQIYNCVNGTTRKAKGFRWERADIQEE